MTTAVIRRMVPMAVSAAVILSVSAVSANSGGGTAGSADRAMPDPRPFAATPDRAMPDPRPSGTTTADPSGREHISMLTGGGKKELAAVTGTDTGTGGTATENAAGAVAGDGAEKNKLANIMKNMNIGRAVYDTGTTDGGIFFGLREELIPEFGVLIRSVITSARVAGEITVPTFGLPKSAADSVWRSRKMAQIAAHVVPCAHAVLRRNTANISDICRMLIADVNIDPTGTPPGGNRQ